MKTIVVYKFRLGDVSDLSEYISGEVIRWTDNEEAGKWINQRKKSELVAKVSNNGVEYWGFEVVIEAKLNDDDAGYYVLRYL